MTRNVVITAVSIILLIAAILFGLYFYRQSVEEKRNISEKENKVAQLTSDLQRLKENQNALQKEIETKSQELGKTREHISNLQNTIESKSQELKTATESINKLKNSESDLNQQLSAKEETIKNLQQKLQNDQATIDNLHEEISAAQHKEAHSEKTAEEQSGQLQQKIAAKQAQLEKEHNKIVDLKKTISELMAKQAATGSTVANLKDEFSGSQSKLAACQNQMQQAQTTEKQLQQEISQLQQRKKQIESKLAQLRATSSELIAKLKTHINNQEVTIKQYKQELSVRFLDRVLFESGRSTITAEGKEVLTRVGQALKGIQGEMIQVIGNTDNVPIAPGYRYKYASNWELSAVRAAAVVRFLQHKCGLDPKNMEAVGRSSYYPVASNSTAAGKAKNRNVEILLKPKPNEQG